MDGYIKYKSKYLNLKKKYLEQVRMKGGCGCNMKGAGDKKDTVKIPYNY